MRTKLNFLNIPIPPQGRALFCGPTLKQQQPGPPLLKRWSLLCEILCKCADYRNLWASEGGFQTPPARTLEKSSCLAKPLSSVWLSAGNYNT